MPSNELAYMPVASTSTRPAGEGSRGACKPAGPTRNGMSLLDVGEAFHNKAHNLRGQPECSRVDEQAQQDVHAITLRRLHLAHETLWLPRRNAGDRSLDIRTRGRMIAASGPHIHFAGSRTIGGIAQTFLDSRSAEASIWSGS